MKRNLILCVVLAGVLLISAVGCQKKPTVSTGDISSISDVLTDSISEESVAVPEDTASEAISGSVAENTSSVASMPKISSQPASATESQTPSQAEPSEISFAATTVEERIDSEDFNEICLLFKPECITSQEEMTQPNFYPEIDFGYVQRIDWEIPTDGRDNYNVIIDFKQYSLTGEMRQQIRDGLKKRNDLLKIKYTGWMEIAWNGDIIEDEIPIPPPSSSEATISYTYSDKVAEQMKTVDPSNPPQTVWVLLTPAASDREKTYDSSFFPGIDVTVVGKQYQGGLPEYDIVTSERIENPVEILLMLQVNKPGWENFQKVVSVLDQRDDIAEISFKAMGVYA